MGEGSVVDADARAEFVALVVAGEEGAAEGEGLEGREPIEAEYCDIDERRHGEGVEGWDVVYS